jgi:hypothetical protein
MSVHAVADVNRTSTDSIVGFTSRLEIKRHPIEAKGLVLLLPRTGQVVVPYQERDGGWNCVLIREGSQPSGQYVGGHNLVIFDCEIETAIEIGVK